MDGFRFYQAWWVALSGVTHLKRIAIGEVRGNIAMIADWNIGALPSQVDVVAVVVEAMRK
jgi:hypothetical protein